jgi:hypothetical protein
MAEFRMSLMDRQRMARDTMAFWFNTSETWYEFRVGQHADFVFIDPSPESAGDNSLATIPGLFLPSHRSRRFKVSWLHPEAKCKEIEKHAHTFRKESR